MTFQKQLETVKALIEKMGVLACDSLRDGLESFTKLDNELAKQVIKADRKIDELDNEIEKQSVRAIARFQPVATDARRLSAYLKVITDIRRIGRYGYNIARLTQKMEGLKHFKRLIKLPEMGRITLQMTQEALHALQDDTVELPLTNLLHEDELVDDLMEELFRELLTYTHEDPRRITVAFYYLLVGRYLERAEDHAVSIGYHVHYMRTGHRSLNT